LLNGTTLAGFATGFGAYWGLSLLVGWFTPFLIQGLGFTQKEASWLTTLPWAAAPFFVITSGWLSQYLLARGVSTRWARGVFGGSCVAIGGLALTALPFVPGSALKVTMVVIGMAVPAVIYVMGHAMVSEFTPVSQRGAMLAINNAVATSAGLIGPYIMGSVVQDAIKAGASIADGYMHGFMICGIVALAGGIIGMLFLRPQREAARFAGSAPALVVAAE
jgi:MFS family permease